MKAKVNRITIELMRNDIYQVDAEVLVNSTTPNLIILPQLMDLAGSTIEDEARLIGWCDVGAATITSAGKLHFQKIIHTVGPKWGEASARGKLANAVWATLRLAEDNQLKSIAIPAISTGTLGYPVENCARTMFEQIIDFTFENTKHLRQIIICVETEPEILAFEAEFNRQIQNLKDNGEGKVRV